MKSRMALHVVSALFWTLVFAGSLQAALVAQYDFTGNANDSSGNNLNGVGVFADLTTDRFGNEDSAYSFDGSDRIDVAHDPLLNATTGQWSMSAWIQTTEGGFILGKGGQRPSYGLLEYRTVVPNNLRVVAWCCQGGNHLLADSNTTGVLDGAWHSVIGTIQDDEVAKLYFDGVLVATDASPGTRWNIDVTAPFQIGDIDRASGAPFIGSIDEVKLFNHVLSQSEVDVLAGSAQRGDTNDDGIVNIDDLNNVRNNFGAMGDDDGTLEGDAAPFDGHVNVDDLNAVRNNFGANLITVPEPSTLSLALVLFGFATLFPARRRSILAWRGNAS